MTTFEQYIEISKKRKEFEENIDIIEKLKSKILDDYDITPIELIKESIDKVQRRQGVILKELGVSNLKEMLEKEKKAISKVEFKGMKKNRYTSMKDSFLKYEENRIKEENRRKELEEDLEYAKLDAGHVIIKTREGIKSLENRVDEKELEEIRNKLKELEEVLESNNIDEICRKTEQLRKADRELVSKISEQYKAKEEDIIDYEDEVVEIDEEITNDDVTEVLTSNMKPNRDDDKTDVLTSDMKPNRDDDKTDVLTSDMKPNRDDDKTDVLTSDMKYKNAEIIDFEAVRNELFKDANIVFDGTYKLYYNNRRDVYEFNIDDKILQNNIDAESAYDFRIINKLKEFDDKNHTKLYERYMKNKLPVHYDFDKAKKNKTRKSSLKKLVEIIDRQVECGEFKLTTVKKTKKSKIGVIAAAIGVAALTFLGGMGLNRGKQQKTDASTSHNIVEMADDAGASDASEEVIEVSETPMINDSFYDIELVSEKVMEDVQQENENNLKLDIEENVLTEEESEIKIGDVITLNDNINLYHASTDSNPNGNTSYLESNSYKIGLVSIVDEGNVVELIDDDDTSINEIIEECKIKYGDDIEVFENLDLLDKNGDIITEHVGWTEDEELGKVLVK